MLKVLHLCEVQSPPLWVRAVFLHRPRPAPCFVPLRSNVHPHRLLRTFQARSSASNAFATSDATSSQEVNGAGNLVFKATVPEGMGKTRLDAWLAGQLPLVSRARVQSNIKQGLTLVNGQPMTKGSYVVRQGDLVECEVAGRPQLDAKPEDIPLDVVYEDEHVLVINKPAHMVVHPAPGHSEGTLVNALLYHCGLPAMKYAGSATATALETPVDESEDIADEDADEDVAGGILTTWSGPAPVIRPGIVHRLDKGTSGLLVVAKDEHTHAHLCDQFKAHSVRRLYVSLTCGVPSLTSGRIEIPIGRDPRDRKRMAAIPNGTAISRARAAASRFRVIEVLANGGSALVEWRLETGRTHQIRVHAQHLGYPLLGDETYGGTKGAALSQLLPKALPASQGTLRHVIAGSCTPGHKRSLILSVPHLKILKLLGVCCDKSREDSTKDGLTSETDTWLQFLHYNPYASAYQPVLAMDSKIGNGYRFFE